MRKKLLSAFLAIALFAIPFHPLNVYAHIINTENNTYYNEVNEMATKLSENIADETVRDACYNTIMAHVFGEHHLNWSGSNYQDDLIMTVPRSQTSYTFESVIGLFGMVKYRAANGNGELFYCCTETKIPLNENGINEDNYNGVKKLYQAAEDLRMQTKNMGEIDKAKTVHNYIADAITYKNTNEKSNCYAIRGFMSGEGVCEVYSVLYYLLGRYIGLDVDLIVYETNSGLLHSYNSLTTADGIKTYIDVSMDDVYNTSRYFMESEDATAITHPRAQ